jgi:hypothetical protein
MTYYDMSGNPGSTFTAAGSIDHQGNNGVVVHFGTDGFTLNHGLNTAFLDAAANGNLTQIPLDGQVYITGHYGPSSANGQLINATGAAVVKTITVGAGPTYRIHGYAKYVPNQSAGIPTFGFGAGTDTAVPGHMRGKVTYIVEPAALTRAAVDGAFTLGSAGPIMTNGIDSWFEFDVFLAFTSGGTYSLTAKTSVAADTFNITFLQFDVEVIGAP